jgi:hypothetical protein
LTSGCDCAKIALYVKRGCNDKEMCSILFACAVDVLNRVKEEAYSYDLSNWIYTGIKHSGSVNVFFEIDFFAKVRYEESLLN